LTASQERSTGSAQYLAYPSGTSFKPAYRPPVDTVLQVNGWTCA